VADSALICVAFFHHIRGGNFIASKLTRNATETEVSPALQNTVAVAKFVSPVAVKVSRSIADAVGTLAVALGGVIADQIHKNMGSSVRLSHTNSASNGIVM
jgi:hypothetical protein